ncbi:(2,3-dihydroxybenzoyl)adenylate synthase [Kitasatospora purpeofusca]|uniref:(2,3-dihydroxybenzoyl)adenylate synthase n=1 Tax=Kitasatospora purpeofusca TaxID=67352 RepID=UPI002A59BE8D|nr:(2,3-dihydroxybenzoyl)adenylate synthase [Kitasatospora purpeofusca]MDY0811911.1 (2,3-dihydroxybenzoyl)adenylate synthase [Kitasatospora purpeofusca]
MAEVLAGFAPYPAEFAARYRADGHWRGETFGSMLRERAAAHPDRIAIVDPAGGTGDDPTRRWTYAELDLRADRMAAGLRARGIRRGDRVVVQLPNVAEFFELVFGLFRVGALPVFALPAHRYTEISYFCAFTGAVGYAVPAVEGGFDYRELAGRIRAETPSLRHVLVVGGDAGEHTPLAEVPADPADPAEAPGAPGDEPQPGGEPQPGDVAFLQLSGGSTGVPKLIPRTHDDYIYSLRGSVELCGQDADSVYLVALPAAHNFPLSSPGSLGTLYAGGRVVLCPQPSPETAFPLIEREGVTITGLVPPLALLWLDAAERLREARGRTGLESLEVLLVGGAKFSEEAARRVRPVLGCTLQQVFGMAEGLVNYTRLDDPEELIVTTQGRPISPDDEVRVVDDEDRDLPDGATGHLLTRGPYTIRGYWNAPEHNAASFTADGFYRTGDLVRRTGTGHLVVEGRAKDQINRGGEKVAAEEIENHLLAHPAVHDAAVVSMPDPYLGERTCAYVVLREEHRARPPKSVELKRFVRQRGLADFKVPDRVEFVDAFPATGIGKVSKKDLRAAIAASLTSS